MLIRDWGQKHLMQKVIMRSNYLYARSSKQTKMKFTKEVGIDYIAIHVKSVETSQEYRIIINMKLTLASYWVKKLGNLLCQLLHS